MWSKHYPQSKAVPNPSDTSTYYTTNNMALNILAGKVLSGHDPDSKPCPPSLGNVLKGMTEVQKEQFHTFIKHLMGSQTSNILETSGLQPLAYLMFALFSRFLLDFLLAYPHNNNYWKTVVSIAIRNGFSEGDITKSAEIVRVGYDSNNLHAMLQKQSFID